jgi:molybdopterin-containing oxidoreductase family membrane subunit
MALAGALIMVIPATRHSEQILPIGCALVFLSLWIEKGISLVVTGFIPSPLETLTEYAPTLREMSITLGIWALGFLILTILYKVAIAVRLSEGPLVIEH